MNLGIFWGEENEKKKQGNVGGNEHRGVKAAKQNQKLGKGKR